MRPESLPSEPFQSQTFENPLKDIKKAVIISHPDKRTTGFPSTTEAQVESFLGRKFLNIQTRLLSRYRRRGYTNLALVYGDTQPDHLSPIYPHQLFDSYLATPTANGDVTDEIFTRELREVLDKVSFAPDADIVIGGYRAGICVDIVKKTLEELGHTPRINYLLTNQAVFMVMSHASRQMLGRRFYNKEDFHQNRAIWDSIKKGEITINT